MSLEGEKREARERVRNAAAWRVPRVCLCVCVHRCHHDAIIYIVWVCGNVCLVVHRAVIVACVKVGGVRARASRDRRVNPEQQGRNSQVDQQARVIITNINRK